jgi:serine phosphatase RsbU (regulator of sigma subunit)
VGEERVQLPAGGALVLLSDGVVEASRASSSDLGPERLATNRADGGTTANASTILKALQMAVEAGLGGERPVDDHTFVVLRRNIKAASDVLAVTSDLKNTLALACGPASHPPE